MLLLQGGWGTWGTSISEPCAYMIALWDIAAQTITVWSHRGHSDRARQG